MPPSVVPAERGRRPRRPGPGGHRSRGIALIAVLWTLVLLTIIAASFTVETRTGARLARNQIESAKARAIADAGIHFAVQGLLERDPEARWRADARAYALSFGGGEITVSVQGEAGKIDLNRAPDELLAGILVVAGVDEKAARALVDAIVDFRDANDLRRLNGAEDGDYRAAGLSYGAKDASFAAVEELGRVLGVTPALYARLAPFVTVHSRQRRINVTVAPRQVLLAVPGIDPVEVDAILAARAGMNGEIGRQPLPIPTGVRSYFSVSSRRVYTIRAEARSAGGAIFVREAIVQLTRKRDPPFEFFTWKQAAASISTAGAPE